MSQLFTDTGQVAAQNIWSLRKEKQVRGALWLLEGACIQDCKAGRGRSGQSHCAKLTEIRAEKLGNQKLQGSSRCRNRALKICIGSPWVFAQYQAMYSLSNWKATGWKIHRAPKREWDSGVLTRWSGKSLHCLIGSFSKNLEKAVPYS